MEKDCKIKGLLEKLVTLFESGNAPEAMAFSIIKPPQIPASNWSLCNNLLLWIAGTGDARGYKQWQSANRFVRTGAKAIFIIAPTFKSIAKEDDPEEKVKILRGFKTIPVFKFEDTDGEQLQYNIEPQEMPPLYDVAMKWDIDVRHVGCTGPYLGYFRKNEDRPDEITLASYDENVFFHELAHAAQYRVWNDIDKKDKLYKEISAELASCVLARIYGKCLPNEGMAYRYIKKFCEQANRPIGKTLWSIISETEQLLEAIITTKNNIKKGA